jgi:hypothetical protein
MHIYMCMCISFERDDSWFLLKRKFQLFLFGYFRVFFVFFSIFFPFLSEDEDEDATGWGGDLTKLTYSQRVRNKTEKAA